ncbi:MULTISPECIES: Ig-like domain-containing protein [Haloferax]|uniref:Ig-like domain-containing protein n=1 Tax=Haloferax TaxID=2251 RepID=UPI00177AB42A|nr:MULTISPECIES: Ig-like domain-containing protein [Haloferax]
MSVILAVCLVLSVVVGSVGATLESADPTTSEPSSVESIGSSGDTAEAASGSLTWPSLGPGDWPTTGRDAGRSGYNPNSSGPKTNPTARWTYEFTDDVRELPAVVADGFVVVPGETSLRALDNETGDVVWNISGVDLSSVSVSDGVVVTTEVDYSGDEIRAYHLSNGTEIWNETNFETDATVVSGGTLYTTRGAYLYAYDVQTGSQRWSTDINDDVSIGLSAAGETVYATGQVNNRDYAIYALNASDGTRRWNFEMEGPVSMSPVVSNGSVYVGSGSPTYDPKFYRLNATDGHIEWVIDINAQPTGAAVSEGSVYVSSGHTIRAFDERTGTQTWLHRLSGSLEYGIAHSEMRALSPTVADGVVYAASERGHLVALDNATGAEQWTYRIDGRAIDLAVADDRLYVLGIDTRDTTEFTRVYAIEESPFQFSGFTLSSTALTPGEQFTGEVTVENVDDEARSYNLSLMADSPLPVEWWALDHANGTLNPGESTPLTFTGRVDTSGSWNVSVARELEDDAAIGPVTLTVSHPTRVDDWPGIDFDAGRTKANPNTYGPKQHLQEVWNLSSFDGSVAPAIANGTVVAVHNRDDNADNADIVRGYDETTGAEKWAFNVSAQDRNIAGSPTVDDGTVFLYTTPYNFDNAGPDVVDASVFALDASDGSVEWVHDTTMNDTSLSRDQAPVVSNGQVYVVGGTPEDTYDANATLLVLDADTGAVSWRYDVSDDGGTELFDWVSVSNGTVVAWLQDEDYVDGAWEDHDRLIAFTTSGSSTWSTSAVDFDPSEPPVVRDSHVYVVNRTTNADGEAAQTLTALNLADGNVDWEFVPYDLHQTVDTWRVYEPTVTNDAVYVRQQVMEASSPRRNELYRLDPSTGALVWNRSIRDLETIFAVDGLVYGGDGGGDYTYVYDASTGEFYGNTDLTSRERGAVQALANGTMILYADSTTPNDFRVLREGGVIEFTDLTVDSHVVSVDDNVTVTATVTNLGSHARQYDVNLDIAPDDGNTNHYIWDYPNREGTLEPGQSTTLTWTVTLRERGDVVFVLQPSGDGDSMARYMYDREGSATVNVGDAEDGTLVALGGPRDLSPTADSWPKASFDAGNTGNNSATQAPTAVGSDVTAWAVNHSSEWTTGPIVANDTVFVGGTDNNGDAVFAYNATDGTLRWKYETIGSVEGSPTYASGYLYTADSRDRVYQFDASTGERLWTYDVGGDVGGITVVDDVAYVTGSGYANSKYFGVLHALNATTREVLWTFERDSRMYGMEVTPAIENGTVYVTSDGNSTHAVDAATGTEMWSRQIAGRSSGLHAPVVADGVVYVDNQSNGRLYALDAADGRTLWNTSANVDGYTGTSPALANETLFFTSDGILRAINVSSGENRWATSICTAAEFSPTYADGTVFVPTTDSSIRAYDADTGGLVWKYQEDYYEAFTPAISGGVLYATGLENANSEHPLLALEGGTTNQSDSSIGYTNLAVSKSNVSTGESFSVSAVAENTGDVACGYTAELFVDGAVADTVTGTVGSGSSNTVEFTHDFSTVGTHNVSIEGLPPSNVTVSAPVAEPAVSPSTQDFGDVDLGSSSQRYVQISNEGTDTLYVFDVTLTGSNTGDYTITTTPQSNIYAGDSDYIWLRFDPSASGLRTATLEFDTNVGIVEATLIGTGVGPAEVAVSPTSHDFGTVEVGNTTTTNVSVSNVGGSPLSLGSSSVTGTSAGAYTVVGGSGTATIAAGSTHNVTVEFAPSVTRVADATLELATNDSDESTVSVGISGNGTITEPNQKPVPGADQYVVVEGETLSVDAPGVLENDQDPDNDSLSATHHGTPDNGSLTFVSDGSFTYTPDSGFTGTDSFVYRIRDSEGTYSSFVTVTVEVLPDPNRKPEAVGDSYAVHAGEWLNVSAPGRLANDRDPDGDDFSASHHGDPSHGTLKWSSQDGSFNYTPDSGFTGTDSYVYRVQDEHGEYSEFATVTIEVLPAKNRDPTAVDDTYTVSQGEWLNVSAPGRLANDYDVDGDSFSASHHGTPDHGTLVRSSQDGSLNYTPDPGFTGTDSYVYRIQDDHGAYSGFATVTIEVVPDNRDPTVVDDHYATLADEWLNVSAPGRLSNDYDVDGDSFSASHHGDTTNGTLDRSSQDGSLVYLPDSGFTGTDSYVYRVQDGRGEYSAFGNVTIDVVDPTRTDPVAVPDHYTVSEGQWLNVSGPGTLANDLDPNGDNVTAPHHGTPSNGTLHRFYGSGGFQYKPDDGFTGTDTFVYRVEDDTGAFSNYTTVTVEVLPDPNTTANRAPTVVDDTYTVYEGQWVNVSAPGRLANDYDVDGDSFSASHHGNPDHGTLERSAQDGSFRYKPDSGFTGTDSYVYRVRDEHGEYSAFGTVTIEVVPDPNRRPDAVDDHYSVYAGEWLNVSAPGRLANDRDRDGDSFSASHHGTPDHGTLQWSSQDGSFRYLPDSGFTGTDSYAYRIQDEHGEYSTFATVTIDVLPNPNRAPTAVADNYVVRQGETLSVPAPGRLSNDYDADNDSFSASHHGTPDNGTLQRSSQDGRFTYTPDPGFTGVDSYVYRIQDEHGEYSSFAQVSITVVDASSSGFADITVSRDRVDFGTVPAGTNTAETITVANIGDQNLTFTEATITGPTGTLLGGATDGSESTITEMTLSNPSAVPFDVTGGNESVVLGFGGTHAVTVEYAPNTTGTANATLVLRSDDPDEPSVYVPLAGESVDDTAPTIDTISVNGSYRNGTTVYANETVDVEVNASDEFGNVSDVQVTLDSRTSQYRETTDATYNGTSNNWTASFSSSQIHDDGRYDVVLTGDDDRGNSADKTVTDTVVVDRTAPNLAATITRVDATTANVTVDTTETVRPASMVVDVEHPDGTVDAVTMVDEGTHWNGTFSLSTDGQYNVSASAIDFAGNRGTDNASSLIESHSTDSNNTITAQILPSELFVRFTTDQPVNDTFVTMTERRVSAEPLVRGQAGVKFLNAALGKRLSDNLSYAVIGIPVDQSLLTNTNTDVDDVTIRYFNETTNQWEDVQTNVENVTINGSTGQYWVANVSHFSTYGAVAIDNAAPTITATTPDDGRTLSAGTTSQTLRVEYEDTQSGVDASNVAVLYDDTLVTADSATTITSDYAEFQATGLTDGTSHTLDVTVEDEAGNTHTETISFTVDTASSGGGTNPSTGNGGTDDTSSTDDGGSSDSSRDDDPAPAGDVTSDHSADTTPTIDVSSLEDGGLVVHIRNASVGEPLSTAIVNGDLGTTGVTVEHVSISPDADGNSTIRLIGSGSSTGPALSSMQGESMAFVTIVGAKGTDTTIRFSVDRGILADRDVEFGDVVTYSLSDGTWTAVETDHVETTAAKVVFEVEGTDLGSLAVATHKPQQTTPTATPTSTPTPDETSTPTSTQTTTSETPGFGVGAAMLALGIVIGLFGRRRKHTRSGRK